MPLFNLDETQSWNTVIIYNNWYRPLLSLAAESVSTDWLFSGWIMFSAPLRTWWPWLPGTELFLPSCVLGMLTVLRFFLGLVNGRKCSYFHVFKSCFSADSQGRTGAALVLPCLSGFSVICCFFVSEKKLSFYIAYGLFSRFGYCRCEGRLGPHCCIWAGSRSNVETCKRRESRPFLTEYRRVS